MEVLYDVGSGEKWENSFVKSLGGTKHEDRFFNLKKSNYEGKGMVLTLEEGMSVFVIDIDFVEGVVFKQRNINNEFIGIGYIISNIDYDFFLAGEKSIETGSNWRNKLQVLDSSMNNRMKINEKGNMFLVCFFVKKEKLPLLFLKNCESVLVSDFSKDSKLSYNREAYLRSDLISSNSIDSLLNIKKLCRDSFHNEYRVLSIFNGLFGSTVSHICSGKKRAIEGLCDVDIALIKKSEVYMLNRIYDAFPGISVLSSESCMSPTKYKTLFTKINGVSPRQYFLKHKISLAKNHVLDRSMPIEEIATLFSYQNVSFFIKTFKESFGVTPKKLIL
ncbi:helix-turn-helix transcriptional regulator [Joostella atrarenae]|uniref:Helix-turn-helix transcriptional regulator n=1 Tax=Joostella atrarenae TaxID=679257 RepID=A0ABS9J769_9FLAO|nr:helix-turn-helix transcriptional regulator [Joostella atrarenae]MCF8716269.1 helix-turn-helix transcriptional regulator [Joostella atrarenae]